MKKGSKLRLPLHILFIKQIIRPHHHLMGKFCFYPPEMMNDEF